MIGCSIYFRLASVAVSPSCTLTLVCLVYLHKLLHLPRTALIHSANANQGLWSALSKPVAINRRSVQCGSTTMLMFNEIFLFFFSFVMLIDSIFVDSMQKHISFVLLSASDCTTAGVTLSNTRHSAGGHRPQDGCCTNWKANLCLTLSMIVKPAFKCVNKI